MQKRFVLVENVQIRQSRVHQSSPKAVIAIVVSNLDLRFVNHFLQRLNLVFVNQFFRIEVRQSITDLRLKLNVGGSWKSQTAVGELHCFLGLFDPLLVPLHFTLDISDTREQSLVVLGALLLALLLEVVKQLVHLLATVSCRVIILELFVHLVRNFEVYVHSLIVNLFF